MHPAILARFEEIKTMKDAQNYMIEVKQKAEAKTLIKTN